MGRKLGLLSPGLFKLTRRISLRSIKGRAFYGGRERLLRDEVAALAAPLLRLLTAIASSWRERATRATGRRWRERTVERIVVGGASGSFF